MALNISLLRLRPPGASLATPLAPLPECVMTDEVFDFDVLRGFDLAFEQGDGFPVSTRRYIMRNCRLMVSQYRVLAVAANAGEFLGEESAEMHLRAALSGDAPPAPSYNVHSFELPMSIFLGSLQMRRPALSQSGWLGNLLGSTPMVSMAFPPYTMPSPVLGVTFFPENLGSVRLEIKPAKSAPPSVATEELPRFVTTIEGILDSGECRAYNMLEHLRNLARAPRGVFYPFTDCPGIISAHALSIPQHPLAVTFTEDDPSILPPPMYEDAYEDHSLPPQYVPEHAVELPPEERNRASGSGSGGRLSVSDGSVKI